VTKTLNTPEQVLSKRRLLLLGAIAATVGIAISWGYSLSQPRTDTARTKKPPVAKLPIEQVLKPGALPEISMGKADAPVTVVEYADLSCPACANFHNKVLPVLKEKYIDKGHVRLVFREFPTNTHSIIATMTMRCVDTDKAPPLISALFSRQDEWRQTKSWEDLRAKLFALSQQVGLTRQAFNACVPESDKLSAQQQKLLTDIRKDQERAHQGFGVNQTPTFFVNTTKLTGATIEDFDKAIEPLLNK
jgi:protein-disulfide isomerase